MPYGPPPDAWRSVGAVRRAAAFPGVARRAAALTSAFPLFALLAGCAAESPAGPADSHSEPSVAIASVEVSPAEDRATALGDTVPFSATARDGGGAEVAGAAFVWSSLDSEVATVDAGGRAVAVAAGEARVVAEAGGVADTARLVVDQEPAAVSLEPEEVGLALVGDTATLAASALDANEHEIPSEAEDFAWSSSDEEVAAVDEGGRVTAVAPGSATITAALGGAEGTSTVDVAAPSAEILSPEPDARFRPGEEVTFEAHAMDGAGNALTGEALTWRSDRDGALGTGIRLTRDDLSVGAHTITLEVTDGQGVRATASRAVRVLLNLSFTGVRLKQAVAYEEGEIPLVAGKPVFLRAFLVADAENDLAPDLQVELFRDGTFAAAYTMPAPAPGVPLEIGPDGEGAWDTGIPADWVEPGLSVRLVVDPEGEIEVWNPFDNRWPASGPPLALEIIEPPEFRARFVPIRHSVLNTTGDVHEGNVDSYLGFAHRLFPLGAVDVDVRPVYTTGALDDRGRIATSQLLLEMSHLRRAEGSDRYYYGVFQVASPGSDFAGRAYVGAPIAVGFDSQHGGIWGQTRREYIYAHEIGHNFGRLHAPCPPGVSFLDANYPYANGTIGNWGWDPGRRELVPPVVRDIMGGCSPWWVSDYTYRAVLEFREREAERAAGSVAAARSAGGGVAGGGFAAGGEPALVLWGTVRDSGIEIEPAYVTPAGAAFAAAEDGPYLIEGLDDAGARLFARSFRGEEVADDETDMRHFTLAVPSAEAQIERLAELRVRARGLETSRRSTEPRPGVRISALEEGARALRPERVDAERVRIQWDAERFPLVVVRDARTGRILSFARGGAVGVITDARELELQLSDGVRSVTERRSVRR